MSDFNSLVQYTVENISRPVKYIIYKLTEFIRVVDKFVFRQVPSGAASGYATIEKIEGNTVAWNNNTRNNITGTLVTKTDDIYTVSGSTVAYNGVAQVGTSKPREGHKYYLSAFVTQNSCGTRMFLNPNPSNMGANALIVPIGGTGLYHTIVTISSAASQVYTWQTYSAFNGIFSFYAPSIIDLTAIFGAGNEPTTVADFEAWMAQNIGSQSYFAYNAGELISCKMQSVKSVGFNQWDEEWEEGGIDSSTGLPITVNTVMRSKNFTRITHDTAYNFTSPKGLWYYLYDDNHHFLQANYSTATSFDITTPSNAAYLHIQPLIAYGNTYNHDICINLSDPAKNGTYQPYMTDSADIDVTTITGINTATNVREVIFPTGMKQADRDGNVKDTLDLRSDTATVRCGIVDLGDLSWSYANNNRFFAVFTEMQQTPRNDQTIVAPMLCATYKTTSRSNIFNENKSISAHSNGGEMTLNIYDTAYTDATALTTALQGILLCFVLENPIIYTDLQDGNGNPLNPRYKVEQGGTEQILPANTSTPTTVAPTLTTTYTKDVH